MDVLDELCGSGIAPVLGVRVPGIYEIGGDLVSVGPGEIVEANTEDPVVAEGFAPDLTPVLTTGRCTYLHQEEKYVCELQCK